MLRHQQFYHPLFFIVSAHVNTVARASNVSVFSREHFDLVDLLKGLERLPGVRGPHFENHRLKLFTRGSRKRSQFSLSTTPGREARLDSGRWALAGRADCSARYSHSCALWGRRLNLFGPRFPDLQRERRPVPGSHPSGILIWCSIRGAYVI